LRLKQIAKVVDGFAATGIDEDAHDRVYSATAKNPKDCLVAFVVGKLRERKESPPVVRVGVPRHPLWLPVFLLGK
jgi:hypothetical protein